MKEPKNGVRVYDWWFNLRTDYTFNITTELETFITVLNMKVILVFFSVFLQVLNWYSCFE